MESLGNPLFNPEILAGLGAILTAVLSWVLLQLARFIGKKTKFAWAQSIAMSVRKAAVTSVKAVMQEYVDAIKAGKADGKLTQEEKDEAMDRALDCARALLNWKDLISLFGSADDAQAALESEIEAAVGDVKKDPFA